MFSASGDQPGAMLASPKRREIPLAETKRKCPENAPTMASVVALGTTSEKQNSPTQGQHRPHGGEHPMLLRTVSKVYFQLQTEKNKVRQRLFGLRFSTAEEAKQYRCDTFASVV